MIKVSNFDEKSIFSKHKRANKQNQHSQEDFEDLIEILQGTEYALNFIADVTPLIKSIELKADPIIIRVNKFDEESARDFADAISRAQNSGQTVIPVIIDSYGGQVYSLMSMISSIRSSRVPVATIIEGKAMSCGAILFSFGAEGMRYMDPDATLMIHDVSSMAWGKVEEVKADAREAERLNRKAYEMMARNCGKPPEYFLKIVHDKGHADWYIDAQEAKLHNLANDLRVPSLVCKVDLKYSLE